MSILTYLDTKVNPDIFLDLNNENNDEFTLTNLHSNTGYNNHNNSGYDDHDNYGCSNHTNSGCSDHSQSYFPDCYDTGCTNHSESWNCYDGPSSYPNCKITSYPAYGDYNVCSNSGYDNYNAGQYIVCSNSGCSNHNKSGSNNHTNSGSCTNHSNSGCTQHANYTNNYHPSVSGVVTTSATIYNTNIPLSWIAASHTLAPNQAAQTITYYLYYKYKSVSSSNWGAWTQITTTTALTYNWNVTKLAAGNYVVRIRAWDGQEWDGGGATTEIGLNGIESQTLTVIHYTAPSWNTVIAKDEFLKNSTIEQIKTEVNKARVAFGLADTAFEATSNSTVKLSVVNQLRTSSNEVRTAGGYPSFGWSAMPAKADLLKPQTILDFRTLLEGF